jgi:hypothetical protein
MDIFENEERKKEVEHNRIHQQKLATLAVVGVLAALAIALLGARQSV